MGTRHNSARWLAEELAGESFEFTAKVKVDHSISVL